MKSPIRQPNQNPSDNSSSQFCNDYTHSYSNTNNSLDTPSPLTDGYPTMNQSDEKQQTIQHKYATNNQCSDYHQQFSKGSDSKRVSENLSISSLRLSTQSSQSLYQQFLQSYKALIKQNNTDSQETLPQNFQENLKSYWAIFIQSLNQQITKQEPQYQLSSDKKFSENDLNHAIVYEDEEIFEGSDQSVHIKSPSKQQKSQYKNQNDQNENSILSLILEEKNSSKQSEDNMRINKTQQAIMNQEISYEKKDTEHSKFYNEKKKSSGDSRILGTPMIKLINHVYPESQANSQKNMSQFKFSLLEDSSFDVSKHTDFIKSSKISACTNESQWVQSLLRVTYAQTQLTYLCQYKNWRLKFHQGIYQEEDQSLKPQNGDKFSSERFMVNHGSSIINKFTCRVQVNVELNNVITKFFGVCQTANSKKQSRHNSSLLCIFELYRSIQGLWQQYQSIKFQKPSLKQPESSNNLTILRNAGVNIPEFNQKKQFSKQRKMTKYQQKFVDFIKNNAGDNYKQNDSKQANKHECQSQNTKFDLLNQDDDSKQKFFKQRMLDSQVDQYQMEQYKNYQKQDTTQQNNNIDIDGYINELKAPKKELYYFVGQYNKVFLQPQWKNDKKYSSNYWEVEGTLKYECMDHIYECRYKSSDRNKKKAEDKISKKILKEIYLKFPMLFNKFQILKSSKGLC